MKELNLGLPGAGCTRLLSIDMRLTTLGPPFASRSRFSGLYRFIFEYRM